MKMTKEYRGLIERIQLFIIKAVHDIFFGIFYKVKIEGAENVILSGKAILASNHESFLDPMVLYKFIPRKSHAVAGKWLFKIWWISWVFKVTECIPTNGSLENAAAALMKDEMLLIFPQGICRRIEGDKVAGVHKGVALLALSTGAPVIPVAINGTFEAWPQAQLFPTFFKTITVCVGKPLEFERHKEEDILSPIVEETLDKIMSSITALII